METIGGSVEKRLLTEGQHEKVVEIEKHEKDKMEKEMVEKEMVEKEMVEKEKHEREASEKEKEAGDLMPLQPDADVESGTESVDFKSDENASRGNWSGQMDFLLSCIGYAVGLGNIWRFPYLCYKNGGGAFLVPYFCFLILCGMPLVFLEMAFGQFSSLSPIAIWKICPIFKGLGYGMVMISGLVCIYYNIIIAWTLFYLVSSFYSPLPWSRCDADWNTPNCAQRGSSNNTYDNDTRKVTPSEEYWKYRVLNITDGIENLGGVRWELFFSLLVAWIVVFLCLFKGVKSSGRVVYVTALFPYIILIILCIRGVTLPGAWDGIKFYLVPEWHRLLEYGVWGEAAMQIFYSVGAAWGAILTMSSYNRFRNNCLRDALIVPVLNCATSVFAGLVIFSIIGFIKHETGSRIEDVVDQGPGLIFVVYPEALTKIEPQMMWAILFFLMIFTVGLDSQFGMFETMISAFVDEFPAQLKSKKLHITLAVVVAEFSLGVLCVTRGGVYVLQIMDYYSSTFSLMLISLVECIVIGWIYGADRFFKDIELMIGRTPPIWYKICWRFITPVTILFIFTLTVANHTAVTYGTEDQKYEYPTWAIGIGACLASASVLPLPIMAIVVYCRSGGDGDTAMARLKLCLTPTPDWGPMVQRFRDQWLETLNDKERMRALTSTIDENCKVEAGVDNNDNDEWKQNFGRVRKVNVGAGMAVEAANKKDEDDEEAAADSTNLFASKVTVQSNVASLH